MDRDLEVLEQRLRSFAARHARPGELSDRVLRRHHRNGRARPGAPRPASHTPGAIPLGAFTATAVLLVALAVIPILEGRLRHRAAEPPATTPAAGTTALPSRPAHAFSLPVGCSYVGDVNVIARDSYEWRIDCGPERNRNARETLGRALEQQGWRLCAVGLGTARWTLDDPRGRAAQWTSSVPETAAGESMRLIQRQGADDCP